MAPIQHRFVLLCAIVLTSLMGCAESKVPVSDLAQAKKVAEQVLEAWKSGSTMEEMKNGSPSIIVSEDLWRQKASLKSYKIIDEGSMLGPNARFEIQLTYEDSKGKNTEKTLTYLVTTAPAITFFREER